MFLLWRARHLILVFGLLGCGAWADTVTLDNGDRLTGQVVSIEGGNLVFRSLTTDSELTIPWGKVVSLTIETPVPVELDDGTRMTGRVEVRAAGDATIVTDTGETREIPRDGFQVRSPSTSEESPWSGNVRIDLANTQGNTHTTTLGTLARVVRETDATKLSGYFTSFYARSDGERSAENYSWGGRFDYKFSERAYGYAAADWLTDSFRQLNLRTQLGLGAGYEAIAEEDLSLALEGGFTYTKDDFKEPALIDRLAGEESSDDEYVALRLAEELSWKISDDLELRQLGEYFPNLEDFSDYLLRGVLELRIALDKNLFLEIGAEDRYDETPPKGVKRNDLRVFAALGFSW